MAVLRARVHATRRRTLHGSGRARFAHTGTAGVQAPPPAPLHLLRPRDSMVRWIRVRLVRPLHRRGWVTWTHLRSLGCPSPLWCGSTSLFGSLGGTRDETCDCVCSPGRVWAAHPN